MKSLADLGFKISAGAFDEEDEDHDWAIRAAVADQIAGRYAEDPETGHPVGLKPEDTAAIHILHGGGVAAPSPTLLDAKRVYLEERVLGTHDEERKRQRVDRVCQLAVDALGRNPNLADLKKHDARTVRDFMLRDRGMTSATARRYLNDLRALITLGIDLFDLVDARNPFDKLSIRIAGQRREDRRPFTQCELTSARSAVLANSNEDLKLIWRMLEGTGCRLGEITGLLRADVQLDAVIPHVVIQEHPHRRLKTRGSARLVPLVGDAFDAAKEALSVGSDQEQLFERYCRPRGSDAASAALMKQVRSVVTDPKVTVHSLRHLMADRLRLAHVEPRIQDAILGHSSGRISENYGGQEALLKLCYDALARAIAE
jgi:integrase